MTDGQPATVPLMRSWRSDPGICRLTAGSRAVCSDPASAEVAELLVDDLQQLGHRPEVVIADPPRPGDIALDLMSGRSDVRPEGYQLDIADHVSISAADRSGLLYGCQSVLQLLRSDRYRTTLPCGSSADWPLFSERGQMIDVGRKYLPIAYLRSEIRRMAWLKLNSLHLHLTDWNGWRFESRAFPGLASPEHYSQDELRELDAYAARWGVRIVPEIDLPGHAVWLSRYRPELRLREEGLDRSGWPGGAAGGWTLDVTSDDARDFVRTLLGEVAEVFSGDFVHIGGDELPTQTADRQSPALLAFARSKGLQYAGDAFVDFINDMAAGLRERNKRTEIWEWWAYGEQPFSISPDPDIRISKWLDGDPATFARQGYDTVGVNWGRNFVTPGYGTTPGETSPQGFDGHMPAEHVYEKNDYPHGPRLQGYRLGRWMDKAESQTTEWLHFFSHRPLQVLAERTWGGPGSSSAEEFYSRADAVGSADTDLTAIPGGDCQVIMVSSEETKAEDGAVANLLSPDPRTSWISRYIDDLELTPHEVVIDLGGIRNVAGLSFWPRQDGRLIEEFHHTRARAKQVRVEAGQDQQDWHEVWSGSLPNDQPATTVRFPAAKARFLRVIIESDWDNLFVTALAHLSILETRWPQAESGGTA